MRVSKNASVETNLNARKWNRDNVWKVTRIHKSWGSLMFTRGLSYIAYLAVSLRGIKRKKSFWGSVMKNTFLLSPLHPQASQPGTNFNVSELFC